MIQPSPQLRCLCLKGCKTLADEVDVELQKLEQEDLELLLAGRPRPLVCRTTRTSNQLLHALAGIEKLETLDLSGSLAYQPQMMVVISSLLMQESPFIKIDLGQLSSLKQLRVLKVPDSSYMEPCGMSALTTLQVCCAGHTL